jgi:hypothetical protein
LCPPATQRNATQCDRKLEALGGSNLTACVARAQCSAGSLHLATHPVPLRQAPGRRTSRDACTNLPDGRALGAPSVWHLYPPGGRLHATPAG